MNALTLEWIEKAEGDFRTAEREAKVRKEPNHEAVCFHSQQCVEKYIKAYLQSRNIYFPKIHNVVKLLELCLPVDTSFEMLRDLLESLNKYAVEFRYPGEAATKADASYALSVMKRIRFFLREKLGVESNA